MSSTYPVSLYLNQRCVFDILAMMENGFSHIESMRDIQATHEDKKDRMHGEIGLKNVFALLGVSIGAETLKNDQSQSSKEVTRQRIHTPNSLFSKMRERLLKENILFTSNFFEIQTGFFVEIKAQIRKNPLIEALETLKSLLSLALIFDEQPKAKAKAKGKQSSANSQKAMLTQVNEFIDQLTIGGTVDLFGSFVEDPAQKLVIPIDKSFLSDPSMSDLVDGEYCILGKVTKVIRKEDEEKISLLRKTSMGKIQASLFEQFSTVLMEVQAAGINLPEMVTEIDGPVIQIIPIGIYA